MSKSFSKIIAKPFGIKPKQPDPPPPPPNIPPAPDLTSSSPDKSQPSPQDAATQAGLNQAKYGFGGGTILTGQASGATVSQPALSAGNLNQQYPTLFSRYLGD